MSGDGALRKSIFGMPLPPCLVKSIQDGSWMHLADSPRVEEVFGQPPVHPRFYSIPGIAEGTKWWREELDEETLECYFGTSGERSSPGYISRTKAVMIGDLGPDLPFALDYRNSLTDPGVVFLGEEGAWRKVAEDVCDLLLMLSP